MIIQSLRKHFDARLSEWIMSGIMATWGAYVLTHPILFAHPSSHALFGELAKLSAFSGCDPAAFWGFTALLSGVIRAWALLVNGAYVRTPIIRLLTSFVSALIFSQFVIGLVKSGEPNTAMITYGWLVVTDLINTYRAAVDTVVAEQNHLRFKEDRRRASAILRGR